MRTVDGQEVLTEAEKRDAEEARVDMDAIIHSQNDLIDMMTIIMARNPCIDHSLFKGYVEDGFIETYAPEWRKLYEIGGTVTHPDKLPFFSETAALRGIKW